MDTISTYATATADTTAGFDWFSFFFSFEGRISRAQYLRRFLLPVIGIAFVVGLAAGPTDAEGAGDVLALLLLWPSIAMVVKRLHDRNRSGWFALLLLIPLLNLWLDVEILFLRGTVGPNRFGPDPVALARLATIRRLTTAV